MAAAVQFAVPDNDFIELTGAGTDGSIYHQGGTGDTGNTVIFVESAAKPTFDPNNISSFKDSPVSISLKPGESEGYHSAIAIWAVSSKGEQLITVTPAA